MIGTHAGATVAAPAPEVFDVSWGQFRTPEDNMPDASQTPTLTLAELRARITAAGVTIPDHLLDMVQKVLGDALAPLSTIDSRTIRPLEPAVTFDAKGPHVGG